MCPQDMCPLATTEPTTHCKINASYHGKIAKKTEIYMSLKPSNMISMQFLTITVDLIIKFRVDLYSRHRFLTFLSKIVKNRYKTILLASWSH